MKAALRQACGLIFLLMAGALACGNVAHLFRQMMRYAGDLFREVFDHIRRQYGHSHAAAARKRAKKDRLVVRVVKNKIRSAPAYGCISARWHIGNVTAVGISLNDLQPGAIGGIKQCGGYLTDAASYAFR